MTINVTDMWNKPQYNSERVNQLLFADLVKILDDRKNFYLVEKLDKYQGWVDSRFIESCSFKNYQESQKERKFVVTSKSLLVSENTNSAIDSHLLFYGTKLSGSNTNNNKFKIKLPNKKSILVSSAGIRKIPMNCISSDVIKDAKRFLGLPYLWGGLTSVGFDCSGFTQTILARFGIQIPRDTKDQILIGTEVARDAIHKGDLIFFRRHVGFAINKTTFIHTSVGGGGVKINSLDKNEINYRKDLDQTYKTTRRII